MGEGVHARPQPTVAAIGGQLDVNRMAKIRWLPAVCALTRARRHLGVNVEEADEADDLQLGSQRDRIPLRFGAAHKRATRNLSRSEARRVAVRVSRASRAR